MSESDPATIKDEKKSHLKGLLYAVKPLLVAERVSGIFRFYYKDDKLLTPNWKMKCYSLFVSLTVLSVYGFSLKLPTVITGDCTLVDTIEEVPSIVIICQFVATSTVTAFLVSENSIKIMLSIAELDAQLLRNNAAANYAKYRSRILRAFLAALIIHIIVFVVQLTTSEKATLVTINDMIVFLINAIQKLEILVFCILINLLKTRVEFMNECLLKFIEEKQKNSTSVFVINNKKIRNKDTMNIVGHPSADNMKIRSVAIMYDKIGVICSLINRVFNFQIFMTLVSTFIYIVITIWASLFYYRTPEDHYAPLITISVWCCFIVFVVGFMCLVCERLRMVRNRTKVLVNQIIIDYDLPKTMRVQAKAFMELIDTWPLQIIVYDMFLVDISLMLKFISVSTTYLIVIIQISHFG